MSSVDNRVVNMKFDNAAFEKGVSVTLATLDKLKQSLNFTGAAKGLDDVAAEANKFNLGGMEAAVTGVSNKFIALSTIAITALSQITNKAISAGASIVKSLTIAPISEGFADYNAKLTSVKTIMNATGESIQVVDGYFKELDTYADKTIYNLSDMTSAFAKFTNAGVGMDKSVPAIKGIANMVALAGQGADAASIAMYNLSQSVAGGFLTTTDFKSLQLANVATKEWKQQMIDASIAAGTLKKTGKDTYDVVADGSSKAYSGASLFNEALSEGWASADVLMKVLGDYGDTTTDIGKKAQAAAQDVKSLPMMLDTLKASVGTGWTDTFEIIFGNVEEATELFTGLTNSIGGVLTKMGDARNKILGDWKALGGRTDLIEGIKNIFQVLANVIKPIKEAFRDIFPAMTGARLAEITKKFREFTEGLRLGHTAIQNIKRTFRGVFAVFSILKTIVSAVVGGIVNAFKALFNSGDKAGDGILGVTASIGDFLVKIDEMLKKSGALKTFFGAIGTAVGTAVGAIKNFVLAIGAIATGTSTAFLDGLMEKFEALRPIVDRIRTAIQNFSTNVKNAFKNFSLGDIFSGLSGGGAETLIKGGLFAGLLVMIRSFFKSITDVTGNLSGVFANIADTFKSTSGVLEQVTANLKTMQQDVKANIILKIAGALALLAAAIFLLSIVDVADLAKSLSAVAIMLGMLMVALEQLEKQTSTMGSAKLAVISGALVALATAMLIMAAAVYLFGSMDTATLVKGITAIAAVLAVVIAATAVLDKIGGAGKLIATSIAILILSVALSALAGALALFAALDTGTMMEGGLKIAGAMAAINAMMRALPKDMLKKAVSLVIVAVALNLLAAALKVMGSMSAEETATALIALGGSLLIIAIALKAMSSSIAGAAAILVFAVALNMLIPPLLILSKMSIAGLVTALVSLAAVFVILGVAGYLLFPVAPVILALAGAVALLGAGAMMAGAGVLMFAAGLALLATLGGAAIAVIVLAIMELAALIPFVAAQLALGVASFAITLLEQTPKILDAFGVMLDATIDFVLEYAPKLYDAGFQLISSFLSVLIKRTPELAKKGGDLVVALIKGIGEQDLKIIKAAGETLLTFLEGLADWVSDNKDRFHDVGYDLAKALIEGTVAGITGLGSGVKDALMNMARSAWDAVKSFFEFGSPSKLFEQLGASLPEGMSMGVDKNSYMVDQSMEDMGNSAIFTMQQTMKKLADVVDTDLTMQPVIAPVIDLTQVREGADKISSMLATKPVVADVSYAQAASISTLKVPTGTQTADSTTAAGAQIVFEQNNYSPKALSPVEIYRNTRNQLSLAKEALAG